MKFHSLFSLVFACGLTAAPSWRFPQEAPLNPQGQLHLTFGQLARLDLIEADPALPAPPRPSDEKLGALQVRAVEPLSDGRGWRLTVQPLRPGAFRVPALDLGNGQKSPEFRVLVPRTTVFGAPWMGLGGGAEDLLPQAPFPWAWASLLLLPLAGLGFVLVRRWRRGSQHRRFHRAKLHFNQAWPPASRDRQGLDQGHQAGRELLALRFGEASRSWGAEAFRAQDLRIWATWVQSLDAARFGRSEPPFPTGAELLAELEAKP